MMLRDEGPTSSMNEDLAALGLNHLFEGAGPGDAPTAASAPPKKGKNGEQPSGDAAAPRTEIPVRQEDADAEGKDDTGRTSATPPKDDEGDGDGGEKGKKAPPFVKKDGESEKDGGGDADEDEDDVKEAVETILNMSVDDIEKLSEDEADGVLHVLEAVEDMVERGSPKLAAAFFVIDSFYEDLKEGRTGELDRDNLIGVVEAFEHVLTDLGLLDESHGMSKHIARHGARAKAHGIAASPSTMTHVGKVNAIKVKMQKAPAFKKGLHDIKAPAIKKGGKKHEDTDASAGQGEPLSRKELLANINALRDTVVGGKGAATQAESSELLDGFKSINQTATTWYEAIAKEVKPALAEGKTDENDPRIVIGRHLEGIANDAAKVGALVSEGKISAEVAENDLRNLADDLDDTVEVMREVD